MTRATRAHRGRVEGVRDRPLLSMSDSATGIRAPPIGRRLLLAAGALLLHQKHALQVELADDVHSLAGVMAAAALTAVHENGVSSLLCSPAAK